MQLKPARDNWGRLVPFKWQSDAYPKVLAHFAQPEAKPALIHAVTGAGKSKFMAQILASSYMEAHEVIVVSTTTIGLVEQLAETLAERIEPPGFNLAASKKIGRYYTHGKDTGTPVIVACTPSLPELATVLAANGKKCGLWIADEAHRSEAKTLREAVETLQPRWRLGFTATPFRAKAQERLSLFEVLLHTYGPKDALSDGVVVPWRIIPWTGDEVELDVACIEMARFASGPGLYNAMSIDDAEVFVMKLTADGQQAKSIHSKLPRGEIRSRVEELRTGKINALVHVSMLQEGVDWPWLRWMCLRRPVGSRVRFAQEVGRALRALFDPETRKPALDKDGKLLKPEAILYDPHGLFDEFKLTYEAVLGGEYFADDDADDLIDSDQLPSEKVARMLNQMVFEVMRELVNANAGKKPLSVTPLAGYLRELITAFDVCGLIQRKITARNWRNLPPTEKQHNALTNMSYAASKKQVPLIHQKALKMLSQHTQGMTRGMCSDLMDVFVSLATNKKWPDLKILDRSAEENITKTVNPNQGRLLPNAPIPRPQQAALPVANRNAPPPKKGAKAPPPPGLFDGLPQEVWKGPRKD